MSRMCGAGDLDHAKIVPRACAADQMQELRAPSRRSMDQCASYAADLRVPSITRLFQREHAGFDSLGPIVGRHHFCGLGEVGASGSQMSPRAIFLNTGGNHFGVKTHHRVI
jgi:hypothetical protein